MTICKISIFSEMAKYDYFQYEYFFKKIVIFRLKNVTKKKTYPPPSFSLLDIKNLQGMRVGFN